MGRYDGMSPAEKAELDRKILKAWPVVVGTVVLTALGLGAMWWAHERPTFADFPSSLPPLPRATSDRPGGPEAWAVKAYHVQLVDGPDRHWDEDGRLARVLEGAQRWFAVQTGGQRFRMDEVEGQADLTHLTLPLREHEATTVASLVAAWRRSPEARPDRFPLFLVEASSARRGDLGQGSTEGAALWLQVAGDGAPRNRDLESWASAALHELLHGEGLVGPEAPNSMAKLGFPGHVVDDPWDLMAPMNQALGHTHLDADRQDYFGHGRKGLPDLKHSEALRPWSGQVVHPGLRPWVRALPMDAQAVAVPVNGWLRAPLEAASLRAAPGPEGSHSLGLRLEGLAPGSRVRGAWRGRLMPWPWAVDEAGAVELVFSFWPEAGGGELSVWAEAAPEAAGIALEAEPLLVWGLQPGPTPGAWRVRPLPPVALAPTLPPLGGF